MADKLTPQVAADALLMVTLIQMGKASQGSDPYPAEEIADTVRRADELGGDRCRDALVVAFLIAVDDLAQIREESRDVVLAELADRFREAAGREQG